MKKIIICSALTMFFLCSCSSGTGNNNAGKDSRDNEIAQKISEPTEIDMFENVEIVNLDDSEFYKQMEKKHKHNAYPVYGYFTTDENPYWKEYCETIEDDKEREDTVNGIDNTPYEEFIGYKISSSDIDCAGQSIVLEFVDESNIMSEFLADHNYTIASTSKEYYIPVSQCETSLISKELYTEEIRKDTDKIISDTINEEYPGYEVVEKYLGLPDTDYKFTDSKIQETLHKLSEKYQYSVDWTYDPEKKFAGGGLGEIYGVFAVIKNHEKEEYALIRIGMLIKDNEITESEVTCDSVTGLGTYYSVEEVKARMDFLYHNIDAEYVRVD